MSIILYAALLIAGGNDGGQSPIRSHAQMHDALGGVFKPNAEEHFKIEHGPVSSPLPEVMSPQALDAVSEEAVKLGLERIKWDGMGDKPVSARSAQSRVGTITVIVTETLLWGYVKGVEVAGVVNGKLLTVVCRPGPLGYLDYATSECARQVNLHFGSPANG